LPLTTVVSLPEPSRVTVLQVPGKAAQPPPARLAWSRSTTPDVASTPDSPAPSEPFASVTWIDALV